MIRIYFMTLTIKYMNLIEYKLTNFHRFEIILISIFKRIEKIFITSAPSSVIMISMYHFINALDALLHYL